jgi:hypothetical protein
MPGSPATAPYSGAPRYDNADGVDFAGQVNGVTDALDTAIEEVSDRVDAQHLVGATLPASPSEGDRFDLQTVDMAAAGARWGLVYRAAAEPYGWEFTGGSPWVATDPTQTNTNNATYVPYGPEIDVPYPGIYLVHFSSDGFRDGGLGHGVFVIGIMVNDVQPVVSGLVGPYAVGYSLDGQVGSAHGFGQVAAAAGGDTIRWAFKSPNSVFVAVRNIKMHVQPVRIGD